MEEQIAEMVKASLENLDFVLLQYITKLATLGWSPAEILYALNLIGYEWC